MRLVLLAFALSVSCASTLSMSCASAPETTPGRVVVERCGALEVATIDGRCARVGVDACVDGFVAEEDGGCRALLPEARCTDGMLATPGETSCHDVAPCTGGAFGDGPFDPGTIYVDARSVSGDGTRTRPLSTIAAAIARATSGGTIAIAAGTYVESLRIDRPLTLTGRCPREVEIRGPTGTTAPTVRVESGVTLRSVSITGPNHGIFAHETTGVVIDRVWVHDTANVGIYASSNGGASNVVVRGTLVERARGAGINASSATVTIESSVIRETRARSDGLTGYGVVARHWKTDTVLPLPSVITLRRSVVERNDTLNVVSEASRTTIDASVIRDPRPRPKDGDLGACVQVQDAPELTELGTLLITNSVIRDCLETGIIVVGTNATMSHTTVRAIHGRADGMLGMGVSAQVDVDNARSAVVSIADSLIADTHYAGLLSVGSELVVERTSIHDVAKETASGAFGDGIAIGAWSDRGLLREAPLTVARARIVRSARAGVVVFGTRASLREVRLACNGFDLDVERAYSGPSISETIHPERNFTLEDGGANACGCDNAVPCVANSSALTPVRAPF